MCHFQRIFRNESSPLTGRKILGPSAANFWVPRKELNPRGVTEPSGQASGEGLTHRPWGPVCALARILQSSSTAAPQAMVPRKSIRTLHCTPSRRRPVHAQHSPLHSPGASPRRRGGAPSTGPGDLASRFPRDTAPTPATRRLAKLRTEVSPKGSTELSSYTCCSYTERF